MNIIELKNRDFNKEFVFSASRSSGPGGQNVNKVNTKVELRFNIKGSTVLTNGEKYILLNKLQERINREGEIILVSQNTRSQLKNKQVAIEKFFLMVSVALIPPKRRMKTKPTKSSQEKRLKKKNIRSEVKKFRKKID